MASYSYIYNKESGVAIRLHKYDCMYIDDDKAELKDILNIIEDADSVHEYLTEQEYFKLAMEHIGKIARCAMATIRLGWLMNNYYLPALYILATDTDNKWEILYEDDIPKGISRID